MLRAFVGGLVGLTVAAGAVLAQEQRVAAPQGKSVAGTFQSYRDGTLTLKLQPQAGEEAKTQEFRVEEETKVILFEGQERREMTGKDGFREVKEGKPVTVRLGESDKVMEVRIGTPAGGKDR